MGRDKLVDGIKIKISRNRTQIIECNNMLFTTPPENNSIRKTVKKSGKYKEYNYQKRKQKRNATIRELCFNNFDPAGVVHITLTFDPKKYQGDSLKDIGFSHRMFKSFIKRINERYSDFLYIATFARQHNGNWHYHMICNFPHEIKQNTVSELWCNGRVYIVDVYNKTHFNFTIRYLMRNLKESSDELEGKHGFLSSKMERDIVFSSWREDETEQFSKYINDIMADKDGKINLSYETKKQIGIIKSKILSNGKGEFVEDMILNTELDTELKNRGYHVVNAEYKYYCSSKRFTDKFKPIKIAKLREVNSSKLRKDKTRKRKQK